MQLESVRRGLAALCVLLVSPVAQYAQEAPQFKLVVVRGENAQNNIKKGRATRPVVEVRDRNNKPVAGALVLFTLPSSGPSGTFVGGGQVASVTTNAAGQASASFTPNTVAGQYSINVSSTVNGQSITAQITTFNVAAGAAIAGSTVAIILAVVGAGAAGTAVALTRGGGGNATQPTGIRIGAGSGGVVTPPR